MILNFIADGNVFVISLESFLSTVFGIMLAT